MDDIGKELRAIRQQMGKTQKEIAEILEIPQTTWSNYEVGKTDPPISILIKLANMGYSIKQLSSSNNHFEVPLLTKEQAMRFDVIRSTAAHSGNYPDKILVPISEKLREYSTDLRAIRVFNNRMAPLLTAGNIAVFEASGWNNDGIYVYFMSGDLHISHAAFDGRKYILTKEFKPEEPIQYDETSFYPIGRVRAVLKEI